MWSRYTCGHVSIRSMNRRRVEGMLEQIPLSRKLGVYTPRRGGEGVKSFFQLALHLEFLCERINSKRVEKIKLTKQRTTRLKSKQVSWTRKQDACLLLLDLSFNVFSSKLVGKGESKYDEREDVRSKFGRCVQNKILSSKGESVKGAR